MLIWTRLSKEISKEKKENESVDKDEIRNHAVTKKAKEKNEKVGLEQERRKLSSSPVVVVFNQSNSLCLILIRSVRWPLTLNICQNFSF